MVVYPMNDMQYQAMYNTLSFALASMTLASELEQVKANLKQHIQRAHDASRLAGPRGRPGVTIMAPALRENKNNNNHIEKKQHWSERT